MSRRAAHAVAAVLFLPVFGRAQTAAVLEGQKAPDFVSRALDQSEVRLADFRGKVVVLDFFASWCGPCKEAMPHLQELAAAHRDDVVVFAVCTSDTRENFDAWMQEHAARCPDLRFACELHGRDDDSFDERASHRLYGIAGLPTTFVIGRDGTVALRAVGYEEGDHRLAAGLARAGLAIDAAQAKAGEEQAKAAAEREAREAERQKANPPATFYVRAGRLQSGDEVPDFEMLGADGKTFALSSLRGNAVVLGLGWSDNIPRKKLQDLAARYLPYGVRTQALMLFTSHDDFAKWVQKHAAKYVFDVAVDPVGKFVAGEQTTDEDRMRFHATTIAGKMFGGGYPAMPIGIVLDAKGRYVGSFPFGEDHREGAANLLLRAGVALGAEDMPKVRAADSAFAREQPRAAEAPVELIANGAMAPDFVAFDRAGNEVRLADYRGKVVVLDFWATWCGPCKAALPHVQALAKQYADQGVVVVASCTSDPRQSFLDWLDVHGHAYPDLVFAHDKAERAPERASRRLYGVSGIPHQFVIDRDGRIVAQVGGYSEGEVLLDAALHKAGIRVDAAVLEQAAADQARRDARKSKPMQPAMPLKK